MIPKPYRLHNVSFGGWNNGAGAPQGGLMIRPNGLEYREGVRDRLGFTCSMAHYHFPSIWAWG